MVIRDTCLRPQSITTTLVTLVMHQERQKKANDIIARLILGTEFNVRREDGRLLHRNNLVFEVWRLQQICVLSRCLFSFQQRSGRKYVRNLPISRNSRRGCINEGTPCFCQQNRPNTMCCAQTGGRSGLDGALLSLRQALGPMVRPITSNLKNCREPRSEQKFARSGSYPMS